MAFDFHLHIPENSRRGQIIQSLALEQQITPEQALDRIIEAGMGQAFDLEPATLTPEQIEKVRMGKVDQEAGRLHTADQVREYFHAKHEAWPNSRR